MQDQEYKYPSSLAKTLPNPTTNYTCNRKTVEQVHFIPKIRVCLSN